MFSSCYIFNFILYLNSIEIVRAWIKKYKNLIFEIESISVVVCWATWSTATCQRVLLLGSDRSRDDLLLFIHRYHFSFYLYAQPAHTNYKIKFDIMGNTDRVNIDIIQLHQHAAREMLDLLVLPHSTLGIPGTVLGEKVNLAQHTPTPTTTKHEDVLLFKMTMTIHWRNSGNGCMCQ